MKTDPSKDYRSIIEALTASTDIFGQDIKIGTRVRSFDFPFLLDGGRVTGLETENCDRIAYVEGVVEALDDFSHGHGYPAYRILVDKQVRKGKVFVWNFEKPDEAPDPNWTQVGRHVVPPANGTPSLLGGRTFGVVAVVE